MPQTSESFNTADSSTLGPDQTWTEDRGDLQIVGNAVRAVSANTLCQAAVRSLSYSPIRCTVRVKTFNTPSSGTNIVMACTYCVAASQVYYGARLMLSSAGVWTVDFVNYFGGSVANTYAGPFTISAATPPFDFSFVISKANGILAQINGVTLPSL